MGSTFFVGGTFENITACAFYYISTKKTLINKTSKRSKGKISIEWVALWITAPYKCDPLVEIKTVAICELKSHMHYHQEVAFNG